MKKGLFAVASVFILALSTVRPSSAAVTCTIDFEGLLAGQIVTQLEDGLGMDCGGGFGGIVP